jgi:hypothetical protein
MSENKSQFKHVFYDNFNAEILWPNVFSVLGVIVGCAILTIILWAITATKDVKYYYAGEGVKGVCVKASRSWQIDDTVFCSDDYNKVVDFVNKANMSLKGIK